QPPCRCRGRQALAALIALVWVALILMPASSRFLNKVQLRPSEQGMRESRCQDGATTTTPGSTPMVRPMGKPGTVPALAPTLASAADGRQPSLTAQRQAIDMPSRDVSVSPQIQGFRGRIGGAALQIACRKSRQSHI